MILMKINLNKVDDGLGGEWWHHIHSSNFGFSEKLADIDNYEVQEGDVLIHKEIQEGERFPAIKYHVVSGKTSHIAEKKEVNELLGMRLVEEVKKNKKFPYACKFTKFFKNGAAQINYNPTQHDKFPMKIVPKQHDISDIEEFLKDLKTEGKNPIAQQAGDKEGAVNQWDIASSSDPSKVYTVTKKAKGTFECTCPQFKFRKKICKHITECKTKS